MVAQYDLKFVMVSIKKAHTVSGTHMVGLRAAVTAVVGHFTFPPFLSKDPWLAIRAADKGAEHRLLYCCYS